MTPRQTRGWKWAENKRNMTDVMSNSSGSGRLPPMTFDEAAGRVPFLRAIAPADRDRLRPYAEIREISAGEPVWKLDDPLHADVTRLLCELVAFDVMQMLHAAQEARSKVKFRG